MPLTIEEFQNACSYLTGQGTLLGIGALFIDANNRMVLDEGNANIDITPDEATLTQALADLATAQDVETAQDIIKAGAKAQASAIPNWASWTEIQATDYVDNNVTDLASAKVVLRAMARMMIALRNERWPDLEGS